MKISLQKYFFFLFAKKARYLEQLKKPAFPKSQNKQKLAVVIMNNFTIPKKHLEKMAKIKEESGISIAEQIRLGIEDFLFRYEKSKSPFMKSLGEYTHPKIGEFIKTDDGEAEVLDVVFYGDVIEELKNDGVSNEEIDQFTYRVEHFLGNKEKYFECEIQYADGTIDRIDWSEYLAFKNKKGVELCPNLKK